MTAPRNREGITAESGLRRIPTGLVVLLVLVAFPLLIILAFVSSLIVLPQLANLPPPQVGNSSGLPGFNLPHQANDTLPALIGTNDTLAPVQETLLVDILAASAIAFVAYALLRAYRNRPRVLDPTTVAEKTRTEEKRREVTEILDAAASELVLGADYRDTVLRCYKLISEALERESRISGTKLTAREFGVRVSEQLKLDSPYLPRVTELFELARYSDREITGPQALEAADCLSNLSASLKGRVPLKISATDGEATGAQT